MAKTLRRIDLEKVAPEVRAVLDDLTEEGSILVLERRGNIVSLRPSRSAQRATGRGRVRFPDPERAREALPSIGDAWKGVDEEALLEHIYATRRINSRPPVHW